MELVIRSHSPRIPDLHFGAGDREHRRRERGLRLRGGGCRWRRRGCYWRGWRSGRALRSESFCGQRAKACDLSFRDFTDLRRRDFVGIGEREDPDLVDDVLGVRISIDVEMPYAFRLIAAGADQAKAFQILLAR